MDRHGEKIADAYGMFNRAMGRVATKAKQHMGKNWWEFAHTAYLGTWELEKISWDEFRDIVNIPYFSFTVQSPKKRDFLSLEKEGILL